MHKQKYALLEQIHHYAAVTLHSFGSVEKTLKDLRIVFARCLCSDTLIQPQDTVHTTGLYETGKMLRGDFPHLFLEIQTN